MRVEVSTDTHAVRSERKLEGFGPCVIVTRPPRVGSHVRVLDWVVQSDGPGAERGFVYESVVDLWDRLHEEMLRKWWDEVGFEEEDGF